MLAKGREIENEGLISRLHAVKLKHYLLAFFHFMAQQVLAHGSNSRHEYSKQPC